MTLERLTIELLIKLENQGYNIIRYNNKVSDDNIIWFPETKENIQDYLIGLSNLGKIVFEDPNFLVISHAIENLSNNDLIGNVLVQEYSEILYSQ